MINHSFSAHLRSLLLWDSDQNLLWNAYKNAYKKAFKHEELALLASRILAGPRGFLPLPFSCPQSWAHLVSSCWFKPHSEWYLRHATQGRRAVTPSSHSQFSCFNPGPSMGRELGEIKERRRKNGNSSVIHKGVVSGWWPQAGLLWLLIEKISAFSSLIFLPAF